jgi:hypothetical protein
LHILTLRITRGRLEDPSMKYDSIPSLSRWQQDSSVALAIRKNDIVLARIDALLDHYVRTTDSAQRLIFVSDLFFTLDYWLKMYRTNTRMEKGRLPAVQALYEATAYALCAAFNCTINGLPRELELMWGREMSRCGVVRDLVDNYAEYITRAEAAIFRLVFKGGKAYQLPWFNPSKWSGPVLAESKYAYEPDAVVMASRKPGAIPNTDYGFFVLTMSRDLYMAKHRTGGPARKGFYHSSYVAGDPVVCGGTMLIQQGVIKRIRFDSGHYQPQANNYRALIMALRMWGVPLQDVKFEDFNGWLLGTDPSKTVQEPGIGTVDFILRQTDTQLKLFANRNKNLGVNENAYAARPAANPDPNVKGPDPRNWWGNRPRQPDVQPPGVRKL